MTIEEKYKIAITTLQAIAQHNENYGEGGWNYRRAADNCLTILGEEHHMPNKNKS